jgi:hypothetical protein
MGRQCLWINLQASVKIRRFVAIEAAFKALGNAVKIEPNPNALFPTREEAFPYLEALAPLPNVLRDWERGHTQMCR